MEQDMCDEGAMSVRVSWVQPAGRRPSLKWNNQYKSRDYGGTRSRVVHTDGVSVSSPFMASTIADAEA